MSNINHRKQGTQTQGVNPENYFIEDVIEYFVTIEQKVRGQWQPFSAKDVQLEFVMLEPYIRTTLTEA